MILYYSRFWPGPCTAIPGLISSDHPRSGFLPFGVAISGDTTPAFWALLPYVDTLRLTLLFLVRPRYPLHPYNISSGLRLKVTSGSEYTAERSDCYIYTRS
jgi:hypothetical protein